MEIQVDDPRFKPGDYVLANPGTGTVKRRYASPDTGLWVYQVELDEWAEGRKWIYVVGEHLDFATPDID